MKKKTNNPTIETTFIVTSNPSIESLIIETSNTIKESTIIETSNPTIETTIIEANENTEAYTQNVKCKISSYQSYIYNLCITCNEEQNFYPAQFPDSSFLHGFIECYNNDTKPINFYFDDSNKKYKPCYETCHTCEKGGNGDMHNCLTCDINHKKEPGDNKTQNCITECAYYYYYSLYGQYKCTNNSICPEEANLYIKNLKKCTDDCNKEDIH